jgi:hypothetical protein
MYGTGSDVAGGGRDDSELIVLSRSLRDAKHFVAQKMLQRLQKSTSRHSGCTLPRRGEPPMPDTTGHDLGEAMLHRIEVCAASCRELSIVTRVGQEDTA